MTKAISGNIRFHKHLTGSKCLDNSSEDTNNAINTLNALARKVKRTQGGINRSRKGRRIVCSSLSAPLSAENRTWYLLLGFTLPNQLNSSWKGKSEKKP